MSSPQERIAQYRKMANDDPDNELGHYRLGKELLDDGQYEEAVGPLRRAIELSPQFSRAYQLLGTSLSKAGRRDDAIQVLREGFAVADERGDNLPREEMARLLAELGEQPPATKRTAQGPAGGPGDGFRCQRPGCVAGSRARRLPRPPMSDELGKRIYENICADCWDYWMRNLSIKVINEMRLDLSTERGQEVYDQIMRETLGLE